MSVTKIYVIDRRGDFEAFKIAEATTYNDYPPDLLVLRDEENYGVERFSRVLWVTYYRLDLQDREESGLFDWYLVFRDNEENPPKDLIRGSEVPGSTVFWWSIRGPYSQARFPELEIFRENEVLFGAVTAAENWELPATEQDSEGFPGCTRALTWRSAEDAVDPGGNAVSNDGSEVEGLPVSVVPTHRRPPGKPPAGSKWDSAVGRYYRICERGVAPARIPQGWEFVEDRGRMERLRTAGASPTLLVESAVHCELEMVESAVQCDWEIVPPQFLAEQVVHDELAVDSPTRNANSAVQCGWVVEGIDWDDL